MSIRIWAAAILLAFQIFFGFFTCAGQTNGMVASGHPIATEAGLKTLKAGGNAIDAAVAVGLTLGVVEGRNSGLGGGCFMLIRLANGEIIAIDGRETAPAAATRDMFLRQGKVDTELSQTGALASGVPGALAAYEYAISHFGTKKLREVIMPAATIAEQGFKLDTATANALASVAKEMARFESSREVFFKNGKPLAKDDLLKQPDLADTYRAIGQHGSGWFYFGPFAIAVEKWMKLNGGILTAADFANYKIILRKPIKTFYRGFEVVGVPPPSSGGVHVAQMLNILEQFDVRSLDEATRLHLIAEAMKVAFADRAHWLGDPDFAKVPRNLVSKPYAVALAKKISLNRATEVASHGVPHNWDSDVFNKHTTHFSVGDGHGNWVACTSTVNTSFGSKVVIPGTGVVMNNEMDDFAIQPGVRNHFDLIGAAANAVAPGKRPLSSMSPTIVLKDGKPVLALGAAGGPKIITAVLMELVYLLDLEMPPQQVLLLPRIHHQWSPGELMYEKSLPGYLRTALEQRGHKMKELPTMAVSQLVGLDSKGAGFVGAADPRGIGTAMGW